MPNQQRKDPRFVLITYLIWKGGYSDYSSKDFENPDYEYIDQVILFRMLINNVIRSLASNRRWQMADVIMTCMKFCVLHIHCRNYKFNKDLHMCRIYTVDADCNLLTSWSTRNILLTNKFSLSHIGGDWEIKGFLGKQQEDEWSQQFQPRWYSG